MTPRPATLPPRDHPPGPPAQLLDHRPHRPRQVHARGPPAGDDAHDRCAADDQPGPRFDGPRAREGDHHQGPRGPPRVHRGRRPDLRPQPHRHARPRRLRLRGQPQPPGLRGGDPGRRRHPGHRGADARQRPPRAAREPHAHPGPQQDRPAVGRPRDDHGRARERAGDPARGGHPRLGQGRHGRGRDPRGDRRADPAAEGRPEGAPQGPHLRQPLRRLQGRDRLRPAGAGDDPPGRGRPADGQRRRSPSRSSWASSGRSSCRSSQLVAGEVGYVATGLKSVRDAQVGDTVTTCHAPADEPLPGYQPAKSLVFAGIYPVSGEDYPLLRDALEKLHLNDASFTYEPESSVALGLRVPLRLPRPAPHGDRPGAPRARVRASTSSRRRRRSNTT